MFKKFGIGAMSVALTLLSGCYEPPPTAWSTVVMNGYSGYYGHCPSYGGCVVGTRGGTASVASYGNLTTVTSSAGGADAAVATNGVSSAVVASAGSANAAVGTSGSNVGISTSAGGNASASLGADGSGAHGTTAAGNATTSW